MNPPSPLRLARLARGLSLADVARLAGASVSQIAEVERGLRRLSPALAERLSRVYGIPVQPTR